MPSAHVKSTWQDTPTRFQRHPLETAGKSIAGLPTPGKAKQWFFTLKGCLFSCIFHMRWRSPPSDHEADGDKPSVQAPVGNHVRPIAEGKRRDVF